MTEYVYLDGIPVIKISGGQEPSAAMCWDMENSGSCITGLWAKGSMGYDNTQIYQDTTHVKSGTYAEKMHVDTGYTGRILTGWLGITKTQIESTHRYLDFWIYSSTANNVKAYAEVKYDSTCGTSEHVTIFDSTNVVAGWNHVNVDLLTVVEYVEQNFDPYVDIQLKVENWNDNTIWLDEVNLSQISSLESVTYLYPDHLGTPISANFDYLPFGDIYQGTPESNLRFPGQYEDRSYLYQNGFRDYNPKIGRYIETDPIGLRGGVNIYSYVGNNPIARIDSLGLTWSSNANFLFDWVTGRGSNSRFYGPNDLETQEMRNSLGADALRNDFYRHGCSERRGFVYDTWPAAWDTLVNPATADWSGTAAQVGGYASANAVNNGDGTVTFTIPNIAGTKSFFYHNISDRSGLTGPMRNISQTFQWTEKINADACKCTK